jgi:hypothetical protein
VSEFNYIAVKQELPGRPGWVATVAPLTYGRARIVAGPRTEWNYGYQEGW